MAISYYPTSVPIVRPPTNSFGGIIYYVVGRRIPSNCSRILTFLKTPRILPCGHSGHKLVDLKKALAKITSKESPRENHQLRGLTVVLRGLTVVACKEALLKITSKEGPRENQQLCGLTVVGWKEALAKINSNESPRENQQHLMLCVCS